MYRDFFYVRNLLNEIGSTKNWFGSKSGDCCSIFDGKRSVNSFSCTDSENGWDNEFVFDDLSLPECFAHLIFWLRDFFYHYESNGLSCGSRVEDTRYICSFVTSMRQCCTVLTPGQRQQVADVVDFYAGNAVFENQYAFLLKSLLLEICDFLKRGGIDQDAFRHDMDIIKNKILNIGTTVSPLGFDESFDDAVFFDIYECWPYEVKALYGDNDPNIKLQYSSILGQDIKDFSEKWSKKLRPDSDVTAKSILLGERIFRDYSYVHYEEYFNDNLGGFEYLSGRSYTFFMAIWFKQVLRDYQCYWAGANVHIDYLSSLGGIYISWYSESRQPGISHDARMVFMDGFKFLLKYNGFEDSCGVSHMMHILFLINALQEGEV